MSFSLAEAGLLSSHFKEEKTKTQRGGFIYSRKAQYENRVFAGGGCEPTMSVWFGAVSNGYKHQLWSQLYGFRSFRDPRLAVWCKPSDLASLKLSFLILKWELLSPPYRTHDNSCYLLDAFYVPGIKLSLQGVFIHLILNISLWLQGLLSLLLLSSRVPLQDRWECM